MIVQKSHCLRFIRNDNKWHECEVNYNRHFRDSRLIKPSRPPSPKKKYCSGPTRHLSCSSIVRHWPLINSVSPLFHPFLYLVPPRKSFPWFRDYSSPNTPFFLTSFGGRLFPNPVSLHVVLHNEAGPRIDRPPNVYPTGLKEVFVSGRRRFFGARLFKPLSLATNIARKKRTL